ncbi:MerR family transcriptional regulator [Bacillus paranthracis]
MEKAYWNHEVAEHLQMGNSTLRRWCLELEKQGYIFSKGEQESRAFTKRDVLILEKIKELQSQGEKLEYAIKHVLSKQEQVLPTPQSTPPLSRYRLANREGAIKTRVIGRNKTGVVSQ